MKVSIRGNPDFGHVVFSMGPGEGVTTESGAMAHMSSDLAVKTRFMGGFGSALARRLLVKESLLATDYRAGDGGGTLAVSPAIPGSVVQHEVTGDGLMLQAGSFLCASRGVKLSTRFGGVRAIFSGEGLFFLHAGGSGHLWINAYGSIVERQVDGELVVDTGHVVGWEPSLEWTVTGMGSLFSTLFSGEGLVLRFKGRGRLWLQTRSVGSLVGWLRPYLRF